MNRIFENFLCFTFAVKDDLNNTTHNDMKPLRGFGFACKSMFSIDMYALRAKTICNAINNSRRKFIPIETVDLSAKQFVRRTYISIETICNAINNFRRKFISIETVDLYAKQFVRRTYISIETICNTINNSRREFIYQLINT